MSKMFIKTPEEGYHLTKSGITRAEAHYGAKYMGYWVTKKPDGQWNETPVDVFYQPNPDLSKGHSHYFGLFLNKRDGRPYITDAKFAFSETIVGILTDNGEVIVSRYRHDFVQKGGHFIDGGRDYTRSSGGKFVNVTVKDGEFVLELVE
jgi:hypothetical protein